MNNLSWLVYVADVVPNVAFTLGFISLGLLISSFIICFILSIINEKFVLDPIKRFALLGIFLMFLSAILPSKQTIYLIAGSEAGEYVATTEAGQEILNDIQEAIKFQLKDWKE